MSVARQQSVVGIRQLVAVSVVCSVALRVSVGETHCLAEYGVSEV